MALTGYPLRTLGYEIAHPGAIDNCVEILDALWREGLSAAVLDSSADASVTPGIARRMAEGAPE